MSCSNEVTTSQNDAGSDANNDDAGLDGYQDDVDDANDGYNDEAGDQDQLTGVNVIPNPSFEFWTDDLPDSWKGPASNLFADEILDYTIATHEGSHACQLINPGDSHKRFTTAAFDLADGNYACRFWVRGKGEIRNGFYNNDYSNYSAYQQIDSLDWQPIYWDFNLDKDASKFELIFSVRGTDASQDHLQLDDVFCRRNPEPCDEVVCENWEACNQETLECKPLFGRCNLESDCNEWQSCDGNHTCVLDQGRCITTADCDVNSASPVCDQDSHSCIAGDPCQGVTCVEWRECDPDTALCVLSQGHCESTADCIGDLPACDGQTRSCVSGDHPANIVPNGGFESWSMTNIPYHGDYLIPDGWYGLATPGDTEIDPSRVLQYSTNPHSGNYACQLIQDGIAERFASESFDIAPGEYTCAYWLRGKGNFRHRHLSSAGWSPYTEHFEIDSDEWIQTVFSLTGNITDFRFILYASYTDEAREHIQVDDLVCTQNPQ
jgi:hypothetical protein